MVAVQNGGAPSEGVTFAMTYSVYPLRGGVHEQVFLLASEMGRRGFRVGLAYLRHGVLDGAGDGRAHARLPVALSGFHPRLWARALGDGDGRVLLETGSASPAALPLRLAGRRCALHLHSLESAPGFGHRMRTRVGLLALESAAGRLCDRIISVSQSEAEYLRGVFGGKVRYVPLAVSVEEHARYLDRREEARAGLGISREKTVVTFVGGMSYPPNREAAEFIALRVAPAVRRMAGDRFVFLIVGPDPPPSIAGAPGVVTEGYVDSVSPYLAASDVCVAPLFRGGGVKMKVLDSLALRKPVIATGVAVQGTSLVPFRHYIPAQTAEEFAERIAGSGRDGCDYDSAASRGYDYVVENHSPRKVVDRLLEALRS